MKQKNYLWSVLTVLLVAMFSTGVLSCSSDDDEGGAGMSESQMREYLESGSGVWLYSKVGKDNTKTMLFSDGKTTGFQNTTSSSWLTPYSIKGNLVYISEKVADEYKGDVLEGGIRITKLTASQIEFYWANDSSEKYIGTKLEDY